MGAAWTNAVCEVCRLLDGDTTIKPCVFCAKCQSWICSNDLPNMRRRALAMFRKAMGQ